MFRQDGGRWTAIVVASLESFFSNEQAGKEKLSFNQPVHRNSNNQA
jgi:hypothetical protein